MVLGLQGLPAPSPLMEEVACELALPAEGRVKAHLTQPRWGEKILPLKISFGVSILSQAHFV